MGNVRAKNVYVNGERKVVVAHDYIAEMATTVGSQTEANSQKEHRAMCKRIRNKLLKKMTLTKEEQDWLERYEMKS